MLYAGRCDYTYWVQRVQMVYILLKYHRVVIILPTKKDLV